MSDEEGFVYDTLPQAEKEIIVEDTEEQREKLLESDQEDIFENEEEEEEDIDPSGTDSISFLDIISGISKIPVEGKKSKLWPTPIHFFDYLTAIRKKFSDRCHLVFQPTSIQQVSKTIYVELMESSVKPWFSSWPKLIKNAEETGGSIKLYPSAVVSQIRILTENYPQWKEARQSSNKSMEDLLKAPVKPKKLTAKRKLDFSDDSSGKLKMSKPQGNTKDKLFSSRYMNEQAPSTYTLSTIAPTQQGPVNAQSLITNCLSGTLIKNLRNGQEEVVDTLKISQSIALYDEKATTTYTRPAGLSDLSLKIEVMSGGAFLSSAPWKERKWTASIDVYQNNPRMLHLINQMQQEICNLIEREPDEWPAITKLNFKRT